MQKSTPVVTKYERPLGNTAFTGRVLEVMRDLALKYVRDPDVNRAAGMLAGVSGLDTLFRDFRYLKGRIRYVPDPPGIEYIASARRTIVYGEPGDCDDMSVAVATLLRAQGFPVWFRAIAYRVSEFTHVYCITADNGRLIPFDLTLDSLGIERPHHKHMDLQVR